MKAIGNYLPWESGYYESSGSYKKSTGELIFCYTYYFSGKAEQIETRHPIDCGKLNKEIEKKCNSKTKI